MRMTLTTQGGEVIYLPEEIALDDSALSVDLPGLVIPERHGRRSIPHLKRIEPRTLRASGTIKECTPEEADKLASHLRSQLVGRGKLKLRRNATDDRYIWVECTNITHNYHRGHFGGSLFTMTITFQADDPFWYSDEQTIEHVVSPDTVRVEAEAPGDYDVRFVGDWSLLSGRVMRTRTSGDFVEINFYGTGVTVVGDKVPAGSRKMAVYLNSEYQGMADFGDGEATSVPVWSIDGLKAGKHTLKLVVPESNAGNWVSIDAFDIHGSNVLTIDNPGTADVEPVVFLQSQERERAYSFLGKVQGDLTIPHKATVSTTYNPAPGSGNELVTSRYGNISSLDGVVNFSSGVSPRTHMFSFSLADTLGGSLDRIRQHTKLHGTWWGRAQGVNGEAVNYESEVYAWNRTTSQYDKVAEGGARFERGSVALNPDTGVEEVANQPRYVGGNYSLRFDGSDASQCWVPHNDAFYPSEGFTMEVWVKSDRPYPGTTSSIVYTSIMGQADGGTASRLAYVLDWNGTSSTRTLRFLLSDGTDIQTLTSSNASLEDWTHLVATFDGSKMVLYRNGEQIATRQVPQGFTINRLTTPFGFGRIGGFQSFPGKVDGGRYYNFALTPAEVADRYAKREIARKPIAHYGFDEGHGTVAYDTAEPINLLPLNVAMAEDPNSFTKVGVAAVSDTEHFSIGAASLKITVDGETTHRVMTLREASPSVKAGKNYTIKALVDIEGETGLRFLLFWYDRDDQLVHSAWLPRKTVIPGQWNEISETVTAPEGAEKIVIGIGNTLAATYTYWVDGLMLYEGDADIPFVMPKTEPYNGTISGATYDQDNPFFEQGGFGHGVMVEEGTTNLIPNERLRFEGWSTVLGAEVTVTQGYGIPGVTPDGATRIQIVGGTSTVKYYVNVGPDPGNPASLSVWVYNIGQKTVRVSGNAIPGNIDVAPGEIRLCTLSTSSLGSSQRQIQFRTLDADDSLDFIAYQPQIEAKPYPTSFTPGTRAPESLRIPTAGVLSAERGQIDIDVRMPLVYKSGNEGQVIWAAGSFTDSEGRFNLQYSAQGYRGLSVYTGPWGWLYSGYHPEPGSHVRVTLKWVVGEKAVLYCNGVKIGDLNVATSPNVREHISLGAWNSARYQFLGAFYGFRILTEPMSDAEIAAEYGKPLTANVHTTCLIDFNRNLTSIMPVPFTLSNAGNYIDDEGKVHILARPKYPSDGTTPAEVATDYVELRSRQEYVSKPRITNKGRNLIVNPGFEQLDSNGWPVGWSKSSNARLERTDTYAGNYALRLDGGSTGAAIAPRDDIPVTPGKWYLYSAWLKQIKGTTARLRIQWVDAQGNTMPAIIKGVNPPKDRFERFEYLVQVPNGIVAAKVTPSASSNGETIFDNLQFEQVDGPDSLPTEYTDVPAQVVEIDTDLVAGDVLKLADRKAILNGQSILNKVNTGYIVDGLKLKPGKNTLVFEEGEGSAGLYKATVKYRPRHI